MEEFAAILLAYRRIAIAGVPRSGKTTLGVEALMSGVPTLGTDAYLDESWDDAPKSAARDASRFERFVLEGVRVPWCLREGLKVDAVLWLDKPRKELDAKQRTLSESARKVFEEWAKTATVPVIRA